MINEQFYKKKYFIGLEICCNMGEEKIMMINDVFCSFVSALRIRKMLSKTLLDGKNIILGFELREKIFNFNFAFVSILVSFFDDI